MKANFRYGWAAFSFNPFICWMAVKRRCDLPEDGRAGVCARTGRSQTAELDATQEVWWQHTCCWNENGWEGWRHFCGDSQTKVFFCLVRFSCTSTQAASDGTLTLEPLARSCSWSAFTNPSRRKWNSRCGPPRAKFPRFNQRGRLKIRSHFGASGNAHKCQPTPNFVRCTDSRSLPLSGTYSTALQSCWHGGWRRPLAFAHGSVCATYAKCSVWSAASASWKRFCLDGRLNWSHCTVLLFFSFSSIVLFHSENVQPLRLSPWRSEAKDAFL